MNSRILSFIVVALLLVVSAGTVSALDNIDLIKDKIYIEGIRTTDTLIVDGPVTKEYIADDKRLIITGERYWWDILEIWTEDSYLDIRLESDYKVLVGQGEDTKVAEFYLEDASGSTDLFDLVNFYDVNDNYDEKEKDYWFKYGVDYIEEECQTIPDGEEEFEYCYNNTKTNWIIFDSLNDLPNKNIKIGLFTNTMGEKEVEWVPNIKGLDILEWASYQIVGLASYHDVDGAYSVDGIEAVAISPDGNYLVTSSDTDDYVSIMNVTNKSEIVGLVSYTDLEGDYSVDNIEAVAISPDGNYLFISSGIDKVVSIMNITDKTQILPLATKFNNDAFNGVRSMVISNDSNYLFVSSYYEDRVTIMNVTDKNAIVQLVNYTDSSGAYSLDGVRSIAISDDGNYLATSCSQFDDYVSIMNVTNKSAIIPLASYTDSAGDYSVEDTYSIAISPDGNYLYTSSYVDDVISIMNITDKTQILPLATYTDVDGAYSIQNIYAMDISDDGNYLITCSPTDSYVSVMNVTDKTAIVGLASYSDLDGDYSIQGIHSLDISSDGNYLATSSYADDYVSIMEINEVMAGITITSPTNTTYTTIPTTLEWALEGEGAEEYCWYTDDGGTTNTTDIACTDLSDSISPEQGSTTYQMWTNDSSNLVVTDNVTFYVDSIHPVPAIDYPTAINYIVNVTDLLYNYVEINPNYCWYSKDSGASNSTLQVCGTNWTNVGNSEGSNTLIVFINDTLGNENQSSITFFMDVLTPTIDTAYPTNITYNTNVSTFNYTFTEVNPSYCFYSKDSGVTNSSLYSCGTNFTGVGSTEGSNTWTVFINDTSTNVNQSNVTFWKDTIIPTSNITYPANTTYDANVTDLNYTHIEANPSYCWYSKDSGASNSTLQVCGTNWTDVGNSEGSNTLTLFINDTSGNENQSDMTFWLDTIGPVVNTAYPTNTTYSSLSTFNYTFTEVNPSYCWYSKDAGTTNSSLTSCGTNFTSMTTTEGQNTWHVFINDTVANESQDNVIFWVDTILPNLNIVNPTESFIWYGLDEDGDNTILVDLNWTTNDTNPDACWYTNVTDFNITVTCADNATDMNITYGTHNWYVWANDTTNNEGQDTQTTRYAALINNSHVGNTTTYETKTETFAVNVTYPSAEFTTSAVLHYDGLTYAATKTGAGDFAVFTKTIDIPTVGIDVTDESYFFNISLNNGTQFYYSTATRNITVTPIILQECNGTFHPFLNYTFKDEELDTFIDASVPSSTFDFWLGNGDVKDSFSFGDAADNPSYAFCFSVNGTIHTDIEFIYQQDPGYPQRTETYVGDLTNDTTFDILYLTGTSNGAYITFQLQDSTGTGIPGAKIQVERKIGGAWTTISTDDSDDAGQVVFYLDITLDHRLTITHNDYDTEIITIRPSQSVYTIILSLSGGEPAEYDSPYEGITYSISPKPGPWLSKNTVYYFTYNISANLSNLIFYSINISLSNGTELNSTHGTTSTGGNLTVAVNTSDHKRLYSYYYLNIGNGTYLIDPGMFIIEDITPGNLSIYKFFVDLKSTETDVEDNYTHLFFLFLFFFAGMAAFTFTTGMELAQPGICLFLLIFFVAICSLSGYFTIDFAPGDFINQYGILLVVSLLTGGYALGQVART